MIVRVIMNRDCISPILAWQTPLALHVTAIIPVASRCLAFRASSNVEAVLTRAPIEIQNEIPIAAMTEHFSAKPRVRIKTMRYRIVETLWAADALIDRVFSRGLAQLR